MTVLYLRRLESSAASFQKPHTSQTKIGSGEQPRHGQAIREGLKNCSLSIIMVDITVTGHNKHGSTSPVIPPANCCCAEKHNCQMSQGSSKIRFSGSPSTAGLVKPHQPLMKPSLHCTSWQVRDRPEVLTGKPGKFSAHVSLARQGV